MSEPIRVGPPDSEIYGPSPSEAQPSPDWNVHWKYFGKYAAVETVIEQDLADTYTTHHVWLKIGVQSFRINSYLRMDRKQAEWTAEMLAKAMDTVVAEAKR